MTLHRKLRLVALAAALGTGAVLVGCGGESEKDLIASAKGYLDRQDHKAAAIQLKAALQKQPDNGEARLLLGEALMRSGDPGAAAVELGKAADLKYDDDRVLPLLAQALMMTGQAKKVTDQFARVTLTDPKASARLRATVAAAWGAQGQLERSEAAVNAALQWDPSNPTARLLDARLTAGRGEIDKALTLVMALLADVPAQREALHLKGDLLGVGKGDVEGAMKAYRDALAADPRYLPAYSSLMTVLLGRRDVDGFRSQFAELKKALPNHPETRYYETQLALLDKNPARARELVQQLLRAAPENALVLQLAGAVEIAGGGSPLLVESHLAKALQIQPDLPTARRLLAQTYLRGGQHARALTTLQPLLERARPAPDVLALAAEAHLIAGDAVRAEELFTRAARSAPEDPRLRTALALTQIAKGNAQAGFAQLEAAAEADATAYADLALVSALLRRGDAAAALRAIDRLQAKLPGQPLPHHLRGRALALRGDNAGARAAHEKALSIDLQYVPAVAALTSLDLAEGRPQQATRRLEEIIARDPKNVRAVVALAEVKQRTNAPSQEIADLLANAVRQNPTEAAPRLLLVEHHLRQRDAKAAVAVAQEAVVALRDDPQALDALGRSQMASGEYQQAISTFGKLAAAQPGSPQPQLRLADAHLLNKDRLAAAASLRKALEIRPNLVAAQDGLVKLAWADRRFEDAMRIAREVQRADPRNAAGFLLEADTHTAQRAFEPAIAALRQALERQRVTPIAIKLHATTVVAGRNAEADRFAAEWMRAQPRDAGFLTHLGSMAMDRRDWAGAEARFRSVLALVPEDAGTHNNIAWAMVQQGKKGALAHAEKAIALAPDRPTVMDTLAAALAAENQLGKAIEWQRKAVAQAADQPQYRLHLAELLIKLGDKGGARAELETLQRLGDKYAGQAEVSALLQKL